MNVTNTYTACPIILTSKCVIYEGSNLIYTGINTNDNIEEVVVKIDNKISNLMSTIQDLTLRINELETK